MILNNQAQKALSEFQTQSIENIGVAKYIGTDYSLHNFHEVNTIIQDFWNNVDKVVAIINEINEFNKKVDKTPEDINKYILCVEKYYCLSQYVLQHRIYLDSLIKTHLKKIAHACL